ncbi:formate hydrogenlyase subunit 3/multisubunit Na+/H+ antiporter, MnhD subunit [Desulfocapsa sulfexigens DSM 10523]|uniref:Formate hydrogenlyase subunit 3/multisubunit Na+/H+ antiporter, MnhD subunit n=1 Tax=Desulfocapsa sulfexigens (strain DSM 10523 / SB164P1) TaxID=1167006 RepID=M1PSZ5_DESSD|nr:proton-conducting transporter membrane subunit [Desulfocapsa sulfexigens]AGF79436.1 formate hydrogenlyase subunit 3/multisubunit Na+/H+ antiporter, MnhD subunit [Desulfocapsa sulfexigens DSM 10523]
MFSSDTAVWIVFPVILPLVAGLLCFLFKRGTFGIALAAAIGNFFVVSFLIYQMLVYGPMRCYIGGWHPPLGISLRSDGPALLMLLMTAATGLAITLYARGYFLFRISDPLRAQRHKRQQHYFWPLWMLLLTGLNGLFLSADIFNLYVTLELIAISAAPLAALSGKPASLRASYRYLLISLIGSLTYLLGVVFLYRSCGVLDLALLQNLAGNRLAITTALVLLTVGLMLKTALVPLHFWLPPAHANALAPVSVILSALVVKASFYLLFRFWFEIFAPIISLSSLNFMGTLGALAIFWGAIQAMRQQRLKLMVAYSTVSQLGYLFVAFPLSMFVDGGQAWSIVVFIALTHACAKSAMFMVAGNVYLHLGHDRIKSLKGVRSSQPITVFAYGIAGVSLMGLPPSGAFIAKWMLLSTSFASLQYWWAVVIAGGSLLAMIYVFRVMSNFFVIPEGESSKKNVSLSPLLEWPPLILALISLFLGLISPWVLKIVLYKDSGLFAQIFQGGLP